MVSVQSKVRGCSIKQQQLEQNLNFKLILGPIMMLQQLISSILLLQEIACQLLHLLLVFSFLKSQKQITYGIRE